MAVREQAHEQDYSNVFVVDPADWNTILDARPNLMVCGEPSFIDAFLSTLRPYCLEPIHIIPKNDLSALSYVSGGTVILDRLADYESDDQRAVLEWLDARGWSQQVIATTDRPLLDLMESRTFSDRLYYRLNTVYLNLGCSPSTDGASALPS
jgi:hypothetical protein